MNPSEARQHLEMADRIIAGSSRGLCLRLSGPFFVIWGLFGSSVDLVFELIRHGLAPAGALWAEPGLLLAAIVASSLYGRYLRRSAERLSVVEREFLRVLWITIGVTWVAMAGGWRIFPEFALGALWTLQTSVVLFFIATHGNRRALAGALILILSLIAANFARGIDGYLLAAGLFIGYAGFGLAEMLAHD